MTKAMNVERESEFMWISYNLIICFFYAVITYFSTSKKKKKNLVFHKYKDQLLYGQYGLMMTIDNN